MMLDDVELDDADRTYRARRAVEEDRIADTTNSPAAAAVHREMAKAYRAKSDELDQGAARLLRD